VLSAAAGRTFTPLEGAPADSGAAAKRDLKMMTRGSRFVRFQEMKLQERAIEVPTQPLPSKPQGL
jgi:DNA replicative helicase MCM subunit Mcm2 (Cdc46/Mcm family)